MTMITTNREGQTEWDIDASLWRDRPPGISAMVRLKEEAEFVEPSIRSISPLVTEVICILQGEQTDGTDRIVDKLARRFKNVRVAAYPFDSHPNGPGHDEHPADSVHDRSYFYNWCLSQTRFGHVLKWDGDMIALPELKPFLKGCLAKKNQQMFGFRGVELVSMEMEQSAVAPITDESHPRLFPVVGGVQYRQGRYCEQLSAPWPMYPVPEEPLYLHFKFAKSEVSITKAWPTNWRELPHFQRIWQRRAPGKVWTGPVPKVLRGKASHETV